MVHDGEGGWYTAQWMDKSLEIWPAYKRLLRYVKPYQTRLALGILLAVAYSGANAATLGVVKKVWSGIFEHGSQDLGLGMALAYAGLLPLVMIVRGACDFGTTYLMNWVGGRVVNDLRGLFFEHLQTLSLDYFTETKTGELISRATNDVGALQNSITVVVGDLVKQPCTLVGVVAGMVWLDWKLTLFTLVLFPLCLLPITVYGRRIRRAARPMQEHQASLVSVMHEALMGMRVVKAFGMEQREAAEFRDLCRRFFSQRMRIVRAKAISTPLIEMISGVAAAFIFLYAYRTGMSGEHAGEHGGGYVSDVRAGEKTQCGTDAVAGECERRATGVSGAGHEADGGRIAPSAGVAAVAAVAPVRECEFSLRGERRGAGVGECGGRGGHGGGGSGRERGGQDDAV